VPTSQSVGSSASMPSMLCDICRSRRVGSFGRSSPFLGRPRWRGGSALGGGTSLLGGLFPGFDLGGIAGDATDYAVAKGALDQRFVHPFRQPVFSELRKSAGEGGLAGDFPARFPTADV